jgi:hypothetical protein
MACHSFFTDKYGSRIWGKFTDGRLVNHKGILLLSDCVYIGYFDHKGDLVSPSIKMKVGEFTTYRAHEHAKWTRIEGAKKCITSNHDGNHVWGVNKDCNIWYRQGRKGTWNFVDGSIKQISVGGMDGQHVWGLDKTDKLFYREGFNAKAWTLYVGKLKQLSCGGDDGMHIWGVNSNDDVYYMNGRGSSWKVQRPAKLC